MLIWTVDYWRIEWSPSRDPCAEQRRESQMTPCSLTMMVIENLVGVLICQYRNAWVDRIRQQYIQHIDIAEALQDGGHVFMVNGAGILRDIVSIHNEFGRDEGIMLELYGVLLILAIYFSPLTLQDTLSNWETPLDYMKVPWRDLGYFPATHSGWRFRYYNSAAMARRTAIIDMKSSHVYSLVGTYIDSTTSASILVYTICTQDPPGFTQGRYPDLLISHATAQDSWTRYGCSVRNHQQWFYARSWCGVL